MATFRSAAGTIAVSTSEITVDLPAGIVEGDLLVMLVIKPQTDKPVAPSGWFGIGDHQHGAGSRMSSMGCWTIATAAMVAAGTQDVVCTSSSNDATMHAEVAAFDISDWDGLLWNGTSDFLHYSSGTTGFSSDLATIFGDGLSIVFHAVRVTARTGAGTTTEGGVAVDSDDSSVFSARIWYNVAEVAETTQAATVGAAGTINATQVGFACFGPSADATSTVPCPDPDGERVSF